MGREMSINEAMASELAASYALRMEAERDSLPPAWLLEKEFCVEYIPICNKQWAVRIAGPGRPRVDKLHPSESKDAIGWANTFSGAAEAAKFNYEFKKERLNEA